jgi:hypothetical protein
MKRPVRAGTVPIGRSAGDTAGHAVDEHPVVSPPTRGARTPNRGGQWTWWGRARPGRPAFIEMKEVGNGVRRVTEHRRDLPSNRRIVRLGGDAEPAPRGLLMIGAR